jgi:Common central domain of tyrosinase/Polyphenol oxidase middle domain
MRPSLASAGAIVLLVASLHNASPQSPQLVPAYPLYCAGPLTTSAPTANQTYTETTTPFQWASVGAGAANPAPGQCVWADRGPRGIEIQPGGGNVICDYSSAMQSVPAGTFVEVGVARDPGVNNCMHLFRYLGTVSPPFSAVPALPPFTRQSIASLTPAQITALRAGIQVMMSRPTTVSTSYNFQASMHGTNLPQTTPPEMTSWDQCQHNSFYFFSWHRMYIYFFDRVLRAAAASAGYPNVVLPYWNWQDPAQYALPLPFRQPSATTTASASWTTSNNTISVSSIAGVNAGFAVVDTSNSNAFIGTVSSANGTTVTLKANALVAGANGASLLFANPLYIAPPNRPAALDAGTAFLDAATVDSSMAFADVSFETGGLSSNGFGGQADSAPTQFGTANGDLEMQPHDMVHSALGGYMAVVDTSAFDPIFYLHHAQIDRLWNRWIQQGGGRADPTDAAWLNTTFTFYDDAGNPVYLTGAEIVDTVGQLNYRYDDDPVAQLGQIIIIAQGAAREATKLEAEPATVQIPLTEAARAALRGIERERERRVFLRINDIRTEKPPSYYYAIYLDPPPGEKLDSHTPGFVGNFSLFSMVPHKMPGGKPMAMGNMVADYDISRLVGQILDRNPDQVSVVLIPRGLVGPNGEQLPLPPETAGTMANVQLIER